MLLRNPRGFIKSFADSTPIQAYRDRGHWGLQWTFWSDFTSLPQLWAFCSSPQWPCSYELGRLQH
jgi:hypothetical protein